ncbi:PREDICTED: serine-enriched protein-like isoform X2 [Amphimedon queenslandica]|uniref:BTB domain-containing protein n=1 Tax=Amphimedon queenslandica TaxID=400682 RepID=A0A1X7V195_AMPQE|nr:PREDICTED: serine-enriched protein-like isoform X2 [Amphimedon queenslandica]|eukprot:XP_003386107.1 PREDICTED: serine-enriched protein-like isoform X2 [Amphimedon queenslandica]
MEQRVINKRKEYRPTSIALNLRDGQIEIPEVSVESEEEKEPTFSFDNRAGLAHDLSFLAGLPELCDVTFLVGEDRQPVCGVRAILAARSRVFYRLLYGDAFQPKKPKKKALYRPSSDGYVDKTDFRGQPTVTVLDFEPEVFKQLMEYIHTGAVMLQSRTLLGLMNAADHYGLDELKMACVQFLDRAINTDTVCALLSSAEKYIQYKSTKILVQKMLEFVDNHAEVVLNLGSFATLPQHVVRIILGRDELLASEQTKFESAFRWCLRYIEDHPELDLKTAFEPFASKIAFHKIAATHLMKKIKPAQIVDDSVIVTALAYQADPSSVQFNPLQLKHCKTASAIPSLDGSPAHIRRVNSSGNSLKLSDEDDGIEEGYLRGGSVPLSNDARPDLHPSRVFDVRADSQASELSYSSTGSSLSSACGTVTPQSPVIDRSASHSGFLHISPDPPSGCGGPGKMARKPSTRSESFITLSSTSVEV